MFKNKKGFFFVVTALILLTYIMANLVMWSQTVEVQQERFAQSFKLSNFQYVAAQISNEDMEEFAMVATTYALFRLNEHSIDNPVKDAGSPNPYQHINNSVRDLIFYGEADSNYFGGNQQELVYSNENKTSKTMIGFFESLNSSFNQVGMVISNLEIPEDEFNFNQTEIDKINVSMHVVVEISDLQGGFSSIQRDFYVNFNHTIKGLEDPSISRELKKTEFGEQTHVQKQIFFDESGTYTDPSVDLRIIEEGSGHGHGWFYGRVYDVSSGIEPQDEFKFRYAIKGDQSELLSIPADERNDYGAMIVTDESDYPSSTMKNLWDKPLYLGSIETFDCNEFGSADTAGRDCVLFVSEYEFGNSELDEADVDANAAYYNVEAIRDFLICGYYFKHEEGPSYMQKLMENSYDLEDEEFGIATFLVWQGIENDYPSDDYSRFDLEFFGSVDADHAIRGGPGCKDFESCSEEDSFVGQFKLTKDSIAEYLTELSESEITETSPEEHFWCDASYATCGWNG